MQRIKHIHVRLNKDSAPLGWRALFVLIGALCGTFCNTVAYAQAETSSADGQQVVAEDQAPAMPAKPEDRPVSQPVPERLEQEQRQLLSQLKGPPEALWLPVEGTQVLAFWQPDRSGKPVGAVLMLPAEGENPRRAATLRRLHEYLPLHGWATLSVELPELPERAAPPRPPSAPPTAGTDASTTAAASGESQDQAAEQASENATKIDETQVVHQDAEATAETQPAAATADPPPQPTQEEILQQIQQRVQAATAYLNQQGQFNVVLLGEGVSALWVLQHLDRAVPPAPVESADKKSKALIDRAIRAVVLVNVRTPDESGLDPLTDWLRHPEVPTFDVFTDLDLGTRAEALVRQQTAKQKGFENYIQRRLPPPNGADPEAEETLLTKAIRGFLDKYAKGVELK